MFNMSASMGPQFADTVNEMAERVRRLGPSPLKNGESADSAEPALSNTTEGETENDS